jgi:hypothetical protein
MLRAEHGTSRCLRNLAPVADHFGFGKRTASFSRAVSQVSAKHVLFGLRMRAIANRIDRDDVLFEMSVGNAPLPVVHLSCHSGRLHIVTVIYGELSVLTSI